MITHWELGLPPLRLPRFTAVFECYFDDSGQESERTNQVVAMAGYLAVDVVWQQFSQLWGHLLAKHGLPSVHMKNIRGLANKKNWDDAKLNDVLLEFVGLIKFAPGLIGFGVAVDVDAWRNLPAGRRNKFGDAQVFCCTRILRRVIDHLEITGGLSPPLLSVHFDQDFQFARRRLPVFEEVKKRSEPLRRRLVSIAFSNADFYYPLQAADLLVWATRRTLVNQDNNTSTVWSDFLTAFPIGEFQYAAGEFWDAKTIENELSRLEKEILETGQASFSV